MDMDMEKMAKKTAFMKSFSIQMRCMPKKRTKGLVRKIDVSKDLQKSWTMSFFAQCLFTNTVRRENSETSFFSQNSEMIKDTLKQVFIQMASCEKKF